MQEEEAWGEARENLRKATSLSKQTILLSHQKRLSEAKKQLEKAKELLTNLKAQAEQRPAIIYGGMFSAAMQEYSEACIFLELIENARYIKPEEIGAPPVDFILGLTDVIGEFRRQALDALREGDVEKGEQCLQRMDEIYVELEALDEAYMLVPGLRRKNDVARRVIESTRGDLTQEVRRKALEDYLRGFEERQEKRTQANRG